MATSPHQMHRLRAVVHQPLGHQEAESAEAADYEVRAGGCTLSCRVLDYYLADVTRL